jgi:hypothetical protein
MTVQTLERGARARLRRILPTDRIDRDLRLPLRAELFLVAHGETGRAHLSEAALCRGLAGAILLELWLSGRVQIGWRYDARTGVASAEPGRISVLDPTMVGDPLTDAALTQIWLTGGAIDARRFINEFATPDLYERVRADLVVTGVLRRVVRRRLLFLRRETYLPVHAGHPVRARGAVRAVVMHPDHADHQAYALAALVDALGLTPYLYPGGMSRAEFERRLTNVLAVRRDRAIQDVPAAVAQHRHRMQAA